MEENNNNNYDTNNVNTEAAHSRHDGARAPRRREQALSGFDMAHISESLEESISSYEHPGYQPRSKAAQASQTQTQTHAQANSTAAQSLSYGNSQLHNKSLNKQAEPETASTFVNNETKLRPDKHNKTKDNSPDKSNVTNKKRKHPVLKLLLLLLILGLGFVGYKFITGQSGYYTVAVFGVDSRNGNVGKEALSDVNIIARVDRASGEIKLVSLYRDTYTEINSDGTYHKLNEAYFRGGPSQAVWAVEHNTDVKVDDYATFNWKAVADTINILGGVDLEITDSEFKYINAFITETVNSTGIGSYQLDHAGMNHLDGVQAVAYARLRLMDTDYQRTARQRKVIGLALDKAKNADYATLLNIVTTVMPQISTSVTPDDLIPFMKGVDKYYISETAGFPFDKATQDVGKLDCVIPVTLESNAVKLHEFLYPDTPYIPSSGLKNISDHIINVTGLSG